MSGKSGGVDVTTNNLRGQLRNGIEKLEGVGIMVGCHGQVSALPPDVRRRLCPAVSGLIVHGLRPSFGLAPGFFGPKASPGA
jgi:hypothetical protein